MGFLEALLLLAAGGLSGLLTGWLGVGGGIILVPVFYSVLHEAGASTLVAMHIAIGTSMLVAVVTSVAGISTPLKEKQVEWRPALLLGGIGAAGALVGSAIAAGLEGSTLRKVVAAAVIYGAIAVLSPRRKGKKETVASGSTPGSIGMIAACGVIASLAGVAEVFLVIPVFLSTLGIPLKKAVIAAGLTAAMIGAGGVIGYVIFGWGNEFLRGGSVGFGLHPRPARCCRKRCCTASRGVSGGQKSGIDRKKDLRPPSRRRRHRHVLLLNGPRITVAATSSAFPRSTSRRPQSLPCCSRNRAHPIPRREGVRAHSG